MMLFPYNFASFILNFLFIFLALFKLALSNSIFAYFKVLCHSRYAAEEKIVLGYCYHSDNVISLSQSQSDRIKCLPQ